MTFNHWKTGEIKTIEFRETDVPANPSSAIGGLERDGAETRGCDQAHDIGNSRGIADDPGRAIRFLGEVAVSLSTVHQAEWQIS